MKILVLGKVDPAGLEILEKHFELTYRFGAAGQELLDAAPGHEVFLMRVDQQITREAMERADKLRMIAVAAAGMDHIDLKAAAERGILAFNIPGVNSQSVAESAIALMLCVSKKLMLANAETKSGISDRSRYGGHEVDGKTLGIIGLGQIGTRVARLALAFGMKVIANDPYVRIVYDPNMHDGAKSFQKIDLVSLDELLRRSDIVTLHCPLTEETQYLIGSRELAMMQPHAYLINTARGPIVDEMALRNALLEKQIAGAAIDVFDKEPTRGGTFETPLLGLDDSICILTPHIAGVTRESQSRIAVATAQRIMDEAKRMGLWQG